MATLSKNGKELARVERTATNTEATEYESAETRVILSFRDSGVIMRRVVVVCANGYKPASPWRRYKKFKASVDAHERAAAVSQQLVDRGWTRVV